MDKYKYYTPMIHSIIYKYHSIFDKEDLVQEGMIGVFRALRTYNPDLGMTESTWVYSNIRAYIGNYIQKNIKILDQLPEYNLEIQDEVLNKVENDDLNTQLKRVLFTLDPRSIDIVTARLEDHYGPSTQLAEKYNISNERVRQIYEASIKKLRKQIT